ADGDDEQRRRRADEDLGLAARRLAGAGIDLELEALLLEPGLGVDLGALLGLLQPEAGPALPLLLRLDPRPRRILDLPALAVLFLLGAANLGLGTGPFVRLALDFRLLLRLDPILLDLPQLAEREEHGILTLLCHTGSPRRT